MLRDERVRRELSRVAALLGAEIRDERRRRRQGLRELAASAGLGLGTVQAAESGQVCSLATYVRLADALRLKAEFGLTDPRRRETSGNRSVDPVHAAMGEVEAGHLRDRGYGVGIDEPFQHYQFAGRADLVAWSLEGRALLHVENKTRFPDLQEAFGTFNAKRSYLGRELAERAGVGRWRSETHVIAALWSSEVLHSMRMHQASFASVCPDPVEYFEAWWRKVPPASGRYSTAIVFDPATGRRDRRPWFGLTDLDGARPRYRDYLDALELLRLGRR